MKALILMLSLALMILILPSHEVSTFTDYNAAGWTASNGLNFMIGRAEGRVQIENGWRFFCVGYQGTCYAIFGPYLHIYDGTGESLEGDGVMVDVIKN